MSLFAKTTTKSFISVAAASKNQKGTIARFRCSGGLINSSTMSSLAFSGAPVQWRLFRKSSRKRKEPLKGCNLACLNRTMDIRAEVNYVSPKEAKRLITEEGYTILDVRDKTQFDRAHIKSCYHVPIFIENSDGDFGTVIKRTLHNNVSGLFFGLPFTKSNSDFVPLVQQQFPLDSKLLLVCQEGLRSNLAAKKLEEAGYQNLSSITSGLQSVEPGTFETNGSKELQDAGKAGLITIQGKISAVLGTFLIDSLGMHWSWSLQQLTKELSPHSTSIHTHGSSETHTCYQWMNDDSQGRYTQPVREQFTTVISSTWTVLLATCKFIFCFGIFTLPLVTCTHIGIGSHLPI